MEFFKFLIENWYVVLGLIISIVFIGNILNEWVSKPHKEQIADVKEWLKYAVVKAEKELGSNTGELKLREVYDWALERFPWIKIFVTFNTFKLWVDEALVWMREHLKTNKEISNYIANR